MSRPVVLMLDRAAVSVLPSAPDAGDVARASVAPASVIPASVIWNADASVAEITDALAPLQAAIGARANLVVVVGLGLLDIAQPELPPVGDSARHALLLRDADRYFPIDGDAAVALSYPFAFAVASVRYAAWMQALSTFGRVRAVTTIAGALLRARANGSWNVSGGPDESAHITIANGALTEVRRQWLTPPVSTHRTPAPLEAIVRGALQAVGDPPDAMLLDAPFAAGIVRGKRRLRLQRAAAAVVIAGMLAWSADRWRARTLRVADAELAQLTLDAAPARASALRLERARAELALLTPQAPASAAAVLARLGDVLPRNAFVQRLDWDGTVWRIDGSAANAPAIVPLLDGDPMFGDVRIVAATTRFMDRGTQRESFSISFRTRVVGGGDAKP